MEKITYASLGALGEDFHHAFETALAHELKKLGHTYPLHINGHAQKSKSGTFTDTSPANRGLVLGRFQKGTREHARQAIAAARAAGGVWRDLGWQSRVSFLRKAADLMQRHQFELAALLCLEVGKNRFEAIAEVSEAIDLVLYYCAQMEEHDGFEIPLARTSADKTKSVL